jgi:hypothetical protein
MIAAQNNIPITEQTGTLPHVQSRVVYLDNLRIYLTILVILHHAAIAYGGGG